MAHIEILKKSHNEYQWLVISCACWKVSCLPFTKRLRKTDWKPNKKWLSVPSSRAELIWPSGVFLSFPHYFAQTVHRPVFQCKWSTTIMSYHSWRMSLYRSRLWSLTADAFLRLVAIVPHAHKSPGKMTYRSVIKSLVSHLIPKCLHHESYRY